MKMNRSGVVPPSIRDGTGAVPYGRRRARLGRGRPLCLPSALSPTHAPFSSLGVQATRLHGGFLYVFSHSLPISPSPQPSPLMGED